MDIDTANSGREELEMSLKTHFDAIFMDHLMPKMDGIECLDQLRNQAGGLNRTTPVIVLTANAGSENRDLYTRAGFDGYLIKPKLFGNSLGVSGLLILVSIVVFGNIMGILGILLAIPLAAIIDFSYEEYFLPFLERRKERAGLENKKP
jgi:CheY-like chemotaxis protein